MTNEKDLGGSRHVFRRTLHYAKPFWPWFLLALVLILCTVAFELWQPTLIEQATDDFVGKYVDISNDGFSISELRHMRSADIKGIIFMALLYLFSALAIMGLNYAQAVILATVGQKIIYNIREDIFRHLTRLHIGFYNDQPIGKLVTRVTNDCETVLEMFTSVIVSILGNFFVLFGVMFSMLRRNIKLSLAIFSVIPIIIILTIIYTKVTRKLYRVTRSKLSDLNAFIAEHVSGMKVVQIFAAEEDSKQAFEGKTEALRKANVKQMMAFAIYGPVSYLLNIVATAILLIYGGKMAMSGIITIGTLIAFQRYMTRFFDPISELADNFNVIQSASAAGERIFALLDTKPAIVDDPDCVHMDSFKGRIEFKNVWFAYTDDNWILKDLSFTLEPGQRLAFVGETGAGKTTIQNLICRYYDIQKGQILIDGVDIRKIAVEDLRRNIGQMLQDVFLFTGTVKSNIRLNNQNISDEDIVNSAKYVNADSFISKLDMGYDHEVIERGAAFSAGQRQLLSFARTLAFNPSVLILDEATANIDTETEVLIQDALEKLMEGRSTIIVAHRLSTIQNCDKIILLHKGRLCEQGTHQELLEKHGMYYKLYKLQYERDSEM